MNFENLKGEIEKVFGKKVSNRPDCEVLSLAIYAKTKETISYNTLRRFFNLAGEKNTTSLSNSTLDILAKYCEYECYAEFLVEKSSKNNLSLIYNLQLEIQQKKAFTIEYIEACLHQFDSDEHVFNLMNSIVHFAFQRGDVNFLKDVFKIKRVFNGDHYLNTNLYFLIQKIGIHIRNHSEISEELWEEWATNPIARYYYFELFVDMDFLMINHFKAIEFYHKNSNQPQDLLFSNSILAWSNLILEDFEAANKYISKIKTFDFHTDIHPITVARAYNVLLLNEFLQEGKNSDALLEQINVSKAHFDSSHYPFFEFWICEGLVLTHQYEMVLNCIDSIYTKTKGKDIFYLKGSLERIKLIKEFTLFKTRKIIKSEIDKIGTLSKLDNFSREYDSLFYYAVNPSELTEEIKSTITKRGYLKILEWLII
jgi:hypothetical protein